MIYFNNTVCVSHLKGDKYALLCMSCVSNWWNPHEKLSLHFLWNGWKNGGLKIKPWFYNHPQHCDNIAHTLSEKTNHHNITIFCNINWQIKLADNIRKIYECCHFLSLLRCDWAGAISKTHASHFIGVSKHLKTIKALELGLCMVMHVL